MVKWPNMLLDTILINLMKRIILILVRPVHKSVVTLSRSTDGEKEDTGEEKHPQPRI